MKQWITREQREEIYKMELEMERERFICRKRYKNVILDNHPGDYAEDEKYIYLK